ncbi:hypothetical protein [Lactococcus taiwanensis]
MHKTGSSVRVGQVETMVLMVVSLSLIMTNAGQCVAALISMFIDLKII